MSRGEQGRQRRCLSPSGSKPEPKSWLTQPESDVCTSHSRPPWKGQVVLTTTMTLSLLHQSQQSSAGPPCSVNPSCAEMLQGSVRRCVKQLCQAHTRLSRELPQSIPECPRGWCSHKVRPGGDLTDISYSAKQDAWKGLKLAAGESN